MRLSKLALAAALALYASPVLAEGSADEAGAAPAAIDTAAVEADVPEAATAATGMELGPVGVDQNGHRGRVHTVTAHDTLWDISDAYLGTPWVWPSVWEDNEAIENPHLIYPGDKVWISPYSMRKVTEQEADALISGAYDTPAAIEDPDLVPDFAPRPTYRYSELESTGFVETEEMKGAASIIDSVEHERTMLSDHTEVIIGYGENDVAVGDQFEIFRTGEQVRDPETHDVVGYAVHQLGWLEVTEVHPGASRAIIRASRSEIERGDQLLPRHIRDMDIEIQPMPDVEGVVMHTPDMRLEMASNDVVYLNRGTDQGLTVGAPLEVFRPMPDGVDTAQGTKNTLPDEIVAKLLVVESNADTSVALVTHTRREINRGDHFRGAKTLGP